MKCIQGWTNTYSWDSSIVNMVPLLQQFHITKHRLKLEYRVVGNVNPKWREWQKNIEVKIHPWRDAMGCSRDTAKCSVPQSKRFWEHPWHCSPRIWDVPNVLPCKDQAVLLHRAKNTRCSSLHQTAARLEDFLKILLPRKDLSPFSWDPVCKSISVP